MDRRFGDGGGKGGDVRIYQLGRVKGCINHVKI